MKVIGGYFELETSSRFEEYHKTALKLNSASSCLKLLIKTFHIKKLHVPNYTCSVVWKAIKDEGCECLFYKVGKDFLPQKDFKKDDYIVYNNYFGINGNNTKALETQYHSVIVDNAQAFYAKNNAFASFYSPRKFFGVPDGGYLYCKDEVKAPDAVSESWNKCTALLKRCERPAAEGYEDFKATEKTISEEPVSRMSKLTERLLGNIDYEAVRKKRLENFYYLHEQLGEHNKLSIDLDTNDVPMVYPFLTDKSGLRETMIANKIYVATYWPGVVQDQKLINILPLPIDQRYGIGEMNNIIEMIKKHVQ